MLSLNNNNKEKRILTNVTDVTKKGNSSKLKEVVTRFKSTIKIPSSPLFLWKPFELKLTKKEEKILNIHRLTLIRRIWGVSQKQVYFWSHLCCLFQRACLSQPSTNYHWHISQRLMSGKQSRFLSAFTWTCQIQEHWRLEEVHKDLTFTVVAPADIEERNRAVAHGSSASLCSSSLRCGAVGKLDILEMQFLISSFPPKWFWWSCLRLWWLLYNICNPPTNT